MDNNKIIILYDNKVIEIFNCDNFNKIIEFTSPVNFEIYSTYHEGNLRIIKHFDIIKTNIDNSINIDYIKSETNIISIVLTDIHKINNYDINFFYKN